MKSGNLNFLEPSRPLQACNGTALASYICSLNYAECKAHGSYYFVTWCLSSSNILYHVISQTERFFGGGVTEYKMCVLVFSATFSKTFLILRRNERDITTNVQFVLVRNISYSCQIFNESPNFEAVLRKTLKCQISRKSF